MPKDSDDAISSASEKDKPFKRVGEEVELDTEIGVREDSPFSARNQENKLDAK